VKLPALSEDVKSVGIRYFYRQTLENIWQRNLADVVQARRMKLKIRRNLFLTQIHILLKKHGNLGQLPKLDDA
jgi:hypothetical protein